MRILLILIVTLIASPAFAAETIYTWGYGDLMNNVLQGIKFMTLPSGGGGTGNFYVIFKFFVGLSLIFVLISMIMSWGKADPFKLFKFYFLSLLVFSLFFVAKTDVIIDDQQNPAYTSAIQDVPWIVAKSFSTVSILEKSISEVFEQFFLVPEELRYSNSGMLTAFGIIDTAGAHRIRDPQIFMDLNNYITDCVFTDILDGTLDVATLQTSDDVWVLMGNPHPIRTTMIKGDPEACPTAYSMLNTDILNYINNDGIAMVGQFLGGYSQTQLSNLLGVSSQYFFNYNKTGQDFFMQSIAINHMMDTYNYWAAYNGVNSSALEYGGAKAAETAANKMAVSGMLASKYIPVIKGILTIIIAGFFPIVILLMVTPMVMKAIIGYMTILFWFVLWHAGDTLLHLVIVTKAAGYLNATSIFGGSYTLMNKGLINTAMADYVNMAGSMYWMIPTISMLVAGGFSMYSMVQLSGGMGGNVQSEASGPGAEMATGSANMGNMSMNNKSGNSSMFANSSNFGFMNTAAYMHDINFRSSTDTSVTDTGVHSNALSGSFMGNTSTGANGMQKMDGVTARNTEFRGSVAEDGAIQSGSANAVNPLGVSEMQHHSNSQALDALEAEHGEAVQGKFGFEGGEMTSGSNVKFTDGTVISSFEQVDGELRSASGLNKDGHDFRQTFDKDGSLATDTESWTADDGKYHRYGNVGTRTGVDYSKGKEVALNETYKVDEGGNWNLIKSDGGKGVSVNENDVNNTTTSNLNKKTTGTQELDLNERKGSWSMDKEGFELNAPGGLKYNWVSGHIIGEGSMRTVKGIMDNGKYGEATFNIEDGYIHDTGKGDADFAYVDKMPIFDQKVSHTDTTAHGPSTSVSQQVFDGAVHNAEKADPTYFKNVETISSAYGDAWAGNGNSMQAMVKQVSTATENRLTENQSHANITTDSDRSHASAEARVQTPSWYGVSANASVGYSKSHDQSERSQDSVTYNSVYGKTEEIANKHQALYKDMIKGENALSPLQAQAVTTQNFLNEVNGGFGFNDSQPKTSKASLQNAEASENFISGLNK